MARPVGQPAPCHLCDRELTDARLTTIEQEARLTPRLGQHELFVETRPKLIVNKRDLKEIKAFCLTEKRDLNQTHGAQSTQGSQAVNTARTQ